jgi:hypothetical protein
VSCAASLHVASKLSQHAAVVSTAPVVRHSIWLLLLEFMHAHADLPSCIAWRTGMLRPASNVKQSQDYWKVHSQQQQQQQQNEQEVGAGAASAELGYLQSSVADAATAQQLLPGVVLPAVHQAAAAAHEAQQEQQLEVQPHLQRRRQGKQQQSKLDGWSPEAAAALHIPGGITLHPLHYMQALWAACQDAAAARGDGSSARLHIQKLSSLAELQKQLEGRSGSSGGTSNGFGQRLDDIVVAAGAAVGSLAEFDGQLPLSLCQGYTLDMVPPSDPQQQQQQQSDSGQEAAASPSSSSLTAAAAAAAATGRSNNYGADSPSLLGSPYLASQGGQLLVVGATKQHDWTAQQALQELGRVISPSILQQQCNSNKVEEQQDAGEAEGKQPAAAAAAEAAEVAAAAAAAELLVGAAAAWPAVSGWQIGSIRSGVRALPPRTQQGSVPLAGRWTGGRQQQHSADNVEDR